MCLAGKFAIALVLAAASGPLDRAVVLAAEPPGTCPPAARLQGEAALTKPIRGQLQARGIGQDDDSGCAQLVVDVRPARPGYDLFISDADGRVARRQVPSAETAAMVIESWALADLAEPLLPLRSAAPPAREPGAPALAAAGTAPVITATAMTPAAPAASSLTLVGLQAESAASRDRSLWLGMRASACVRWGVTCLGPAGHVSQLVQPAPGAAGQIWARDLEAALALEAPIALGRRLALLPRLAAGMGWRQQRWQPDAPAPGGAEGGQRDRGRRSRYDGRYDGDRRGDPGVALAGPAVAEARAGSARFDAGVGALLRLVGGVALELTTSIAGVVPLATDAGGSPAERVRSQLRVGLGLRYGRL